MYYVKLESGLVLETNDPSLWPEGTRLSVAEGRRLLKAEAIKKLKKLVKPGSTVLTDLRHCSRSGMSRRIKLFVNKRNETIDITNLAARAMDYPYPEDGIKIGGCGMDMGFALVYGLGHVLWPKGTRRPHGTRNGEPYHTGGYALKQRWL